MSWVVGAPARNLSSGDRRKMWPEPLGGATGTIAAPSRDAAARGEGIPQRYATDPPTDGPAGFVDLGGYTPPHFDWSEGGWHGSPRYPMPTPRGLSVTQYLRMLFPNVFGLLGFRTTGSSTTEWTTDDNDSEQPYAAAPIRFDFKPLAYTLRDLFDRRIYADYWPNERLQTSQQPREIQKGVRASVPQMLEPYFPLLTRYQKPSSYGAKTITLVSPTSTRPPGAS